MVAGDLVVAEKSNSMRLGGCHRASMGCTNVALNTAHITSPTKLDFPHGFSISSSFP